jgi:MscS family membrane protein
MDAMNAEFAEFWAIVVEVWQTSFLGLSVGDGLIATRRLHRCAAGARAFSHLLMRRLIAQADKTETELDDALVKALAGPVKMIPVIIGTHFAL